MRGWLSLETSGIKIAMNRSLVHKLWGRKKPSYIDLAEELHSFYSAFVCAASAAGLLTSRSI